MALSCRAQPVPSAATGPVVLVTPETGPSELQRSLAAQPPAASSAGDARLDRALDAFHARTAGRRGYLAVDKPLYQPGETVWFRGFELASADLRGAERDIATVALISPRGSKTAEKQILVDHGAAANDFVLPADLAGGEYTLRAETVHGTIAERKLIVAAYQPPRIKKKLEFLRKAYGPGDTVKATVALHRATGEPLGSRSVTGLVTLDGVDLARVPVTTDPQGNAVVQFPLPATIQRGEGLLTMLVDDGGVTESVQKRIPILLADLQLSMYPEGGELVAGLPSRIYFAAKNAIDKPADIEGRVVDDRGRTVALLRSFHDGLGRFELVPQPRRSYHVQITRPTGIARTFALPGARASGCTVQAVDDIASERPELRVAVWCSATQPVVTTAVLRERRVATATTTVPAGKPTIVALKLPAGAQGAVRVTVFDGALAPLAERLVYRNRGADLKIAIQPDRATYNPRDRVSLAVVATTPDGKPVAADLAVSVVDDTVLAFADDKQATLLARLYLEAEMPGQKIEEPNFYFGPDPKAPAALDLVLGTHGWRRFDWKPVMAAPPAPPIEESWAFHGDPWAPRTKRHAPVRRGRRAAVAAEVEAVDEDDDGDARDRDADAPDKVDRKVGRAEAPRRQNQEAPRAKKAPERAGPAPRPEPLEPAAPQPVMRNRPAQMDMEMEAAGGDWAEDDEDLAIVAADAPRRGAFDNRGFDVGGEARARRVQIRGRLGEEQAAVADPYCCLAPSRVFPLPTHDVRYDGPRTDFRETLLWAPRVQTDAAGKATLSFSLSDEVTSFKVTAEGVGGGRLGRGEALVQSKKPVSLAVKLPLEVTAGDHVRLPVTVANETDRPYTATLTASFGKAFRVQGGLPPTITLRANERRAAFYELDVIGDGATAADGRIALGVEAANLRDELEKTITIAGPGFPQQASIAGTLTRTARHEIVVSDVIPGTLHGMVTLYPSPVATMIEGTEAMIAEPGGCFEQASSTNYPNIMILGYLEQHDAAAPAIAERANKALDQGYKLLAGYETKTKGYEWFGSSPGHEALTAYGLMEFADMKKVYGDVDRSMIDRTQRWLRTRRDGQGGYQRNAQALDSFGAASPEVTDGYITYALTEAGDRDLGPELSKQRKVGATAKDPYLVAMAAKSLVNAEPKADTTRKALARLIELQDKDGSFPGADHSITRSGGAALGIETASIAAMALMSAGDGYMPAARKAIDWLSQQRNGSGGFSSTQATVLALKALAQYASASRRTDAAGTVILRVNGIEVARQSYEKGHQGAIELPVAKHLAPGKNVVELTLESTSPLPYSGMVEWSSKVPASEPATKVELATTLARSKATLGEGVRMNVRITNRTQHGLPMTLARVALPGGLTFQTWQLKELRDKHLVAFYETGAREVILYLRSMKPGAVVDVPLELIATVPGTYTAAASRAYLYYTDEHKHWVAPTSITIATAGDAP